MSSFFFCDGFIRIYWKLFCKKFLVFYLEMKYDFNKFWKFFICGFLSVLEDFIEIWKGGYIIILFFLVWMEFIYGWWNGWYFYSKYYLNKEFFYFWGIVWSINLCLDLGRSDVWLIGGFCCCEIIFLCWLVFFLCICI